MRQHHTNALLPHDAVDEVHKCARLGATIPWTAAIPAMPTDNVLPALAGSADDSTLQIKDGCIVGFCCRCHVRV